MSDDLQLSTSVGALLIGDMVALAIWGTSSFQTYIYFTQSTFQEQWIKLLVAVLWFLDTLHIAFASHGMYYYLVLNYSNPSALAFINWSIAITVAITALITFIVHCFFARKLYILNPTIFWIPCVIVLLTSARLGFGLAATTQCFKQKTYENLSHFVHWLFTTGLALAVLSDIFVTAAFCIYLARSRTGFSNMDAILATLIRYTIQSGAATCIVAGAAMLCAALMPHNAVWIAIHFSISKLYTASTVAGLNSRNPLRAQTNDILESTQTRSHIAVHIHTTRARHADEEDHELGSVTSPAPRWSQDKSFKPGSLASSVTKSDYPYSPGEKDVNDEV
ncbi:hypothetical protein SISNIDRAFT_494350 [Sistotremastrum niveocremeum HHB9708]|uniref:DUF6534 domain-containing protein n=2 Tax=Sistotremastraceae TaxID=3402574 RepID=A0A164WWA0_9AGAM|nr:hypothetical protein SISNIDRAFT_494350 [Sistotremastrum niveocremeum HHB9708]KZT39798.1 hypothetical protein SISSUDRAFT_1045119 [Sistotremastrum suecicum HHB10207 ss-3]